MLAVRMRTAGAAPTLVSCGCARKADGARDTPMRILLSLAALLIVLYVMMQLGHKQLQALDAEGAAASAGAAATPRNAAEAAARRVTDAVQQGAAARASDAAQR